MPKTNCIPVALKRMHVQFFGLWAQYNVAKAHNALDIGLWAQYIVAKALCYKLTLCVCVCVQYIVLTVPPCCVNVYASQASHYSGTCVYIHLWIDIVSDIPITLPFTF